MQSQRGFSFVELMVATVVGAILTLLIGKIFIINKQIFSTQTDLALLQENGRLALSFIVKDLRMSGFYGCASPMHSPTFALQGSAAEPLIEALAEPLRGFDTASDVADDHELSHDYAQSSSVLLIRRAADDSFGLIGIDADGNLLAVAKKTAKLTGGCVDNLCVGQIAVISDCTKNVLLKIASLSVKTLNTHAQITLTPTEPLASLSEFNHQFEYADIYPVESIGYFIAIGSAGFPTLWQKKSRESAFEILEGVEQLSISYRTQTAADYLPAGDLSQTDWQKVTGVKLEVLVRSQSPTIGMEPQTYEWRGETIRAADGYLRQVFSTVVALRGGLE